MVHSTLVKNPFAASFSCNLVLDGISYTFGILLEPITDHYGTSKGVISTVGSMLGGVLALSAPLGSVLVDKFGTR